MNYITNTTSISPKYTTLNLVNLLGLIINENDNNALAEFHNNRDIFILDSGKRVIFLNFIEHLCDSHWALEMVNRNYSLLESSFDQIVDRYSCMPESECKLNSEKSVDCRKYFGACLNKISECCKNIKDPVRKDIHAASILQGLVINNFAYCCREAVRSNDPSWSRYVWQINGSGITLWMPAFLRGRQRFKWLISNIPDVDPNKDDERQRIQEIVDSHFNRYSRYQVDSYWGTTDKNSRSPYENLIENEIQAKGLAETVANEKCRDIDILRPSIRKMGKSSLYKLIKEIFELIECDRYEETQVARRFGLSPSTLCRFAGIKWEVFSEKRPPDLWCNLAQVLAKYPLFSEVACQCGLWEDIKSIIPQINDDI